MCGFGGVINSKRQLSLPHVARVAAGVSFRGPDSCGLRILNDDLQQSDEGRSAIFFNRLAILDLDTRSNQPFEDNDYLLTFNGEIYNYQELKARLESKGIQFRTTSDTEVLFCSLKEWGVDALKKLNGMFSFFWLNKKDRTFIAARDRLGIKPLYYCLDDDGFYFGSELHSILRLRTKTATISAEAIKMYLWMQYIPTPYTAIEGVHKLPPGKYILGSIAENNQISIHSYWDAYDVVTEQTHGNEKDLETVLKSSLNRQLHADVPLGLFLSSGIDSSLLAALVNKHFATDNDINFFTVQFEESTIADESSDARNFIAGFNNPRLHCNTIQVNPSIIQSRLDQLYDYFDEPFGDHASLLNWMISDKARHYVTVAISGDGADELFWGYHRYQRWQQFKKLSRLPIVSSLALAAGNLFPGNIRHNTRFILEKDAVKRHFNLFLPSGMRFTIHDHITKYPLWALEGVSRVASRNDLPAVLDIKTYLADAMLYKVDRASMASSLEVRVPYLDNEVVDYALKMPLSEKSNHIHKNKAPLKNLLTQLAPHYGIHKPKKGFTFPLQAWLKENWKDKVLSSVNKNDLISAGIDAEPYLKLVEDFYKSRNNYFTDVWYIFNLSLWINKFKK
jgi:asparagine synthase (glutamine-hydrolysing)